MFASAFIIDEDPVTGVANGPLGLIGSTTDWFIPRGLFCLPGGPAVTVFKAVVGLWSSGYCLDKLPENE